MGEAYLRIRQCSALLNFDAVAAIETLHIDIGGQHLFNHSAGGVEHGIAGDHAAEISLALPQAVAIHHIPQGSGALLIVVVGAELGVVMALVLVTIVQAEEIEVLEAEVDGSTDTDIAHQGIDSAENSAGGQMREIILVKLPPRLTDFEYKSRVVEQGGAIGMDDVRTQEQHIAQIVGIIQVHQEVIDDFGSFGLDMDVRLDAHLVQGRDGTATGNDDGLVLVLLDDSNGVIQRRAVGDNKDGSPLKFR
ncbi:hypothetical protein D3C77_430420 [compost metagenome]